MFVIDYHFLTDVLRNTLRALFNKEITLTTNSYRSYNAKKIP